METPDSVPPPVSPASTPEAQDIAENKDLAALSYVWVLALVVHFSAHNSPFAKFHCRQGLVLFVISLVGAFVPGFIGTLLLLIVLALSVLGFLNAAQGLKKDLPVVGPLARADIHGLTSHMTSALEWLRKLWKHAPKKQQPAKESPQASKVTVVEATPVSTPTVQTPVPPVPSTTTDQTSSVPPTPPQAS